MEVKSCDVVALLEDDPANELVRDQVGTAVEQLQPGVFEVEFSANNGKSYATVALPVEKLLVLHHEAVEAA
jgi:hypothetical protein